MAAIIAGSHVTISDDDLMRISSENPGWRIERTDEGALIVSPTSTSGGAKSGAAFVQLHEYARRAGGKAYGSSTGFKTPGGGVLSPDAAWLCAEQVERFAEDDGFWPVQPDVVIEIASKTDSWPRLCAKIDAYVADGAGYALAIEPQSGKRYERGLAPPALVVDVDAILAA